MSIRPDGKRIFFPGHYTSTAWSGWTFGEIIRTEECADALLALLGDTSTKTRSENAGMLGAWKQRKIVAASRVLKEAHPHGDLHWWHEAAERIMEVPHAIVNEASDEAVIINVAPLAQKAGIIVSDTSSPKKIADEIRRQGKKLDAVMGIKAR